MKENNKNEQKSDEELAGLVKNNPDFYYLLLERYEDKILRYIRRISNFSKETSEDLGQEIFIKAYENINDFDQGLKFSSWLYRIARNHVISFWRKNKKESNTFSFDVDENLKNMFEADQDIVKDLDNKINKEALEKALSNLRSDYREVLVLRFLEDKDYSEMGDILRKPVGTVGTFLSRAKKELKKELLKNNFKQ